MLDNPFFRRFAAGAIGGVVQRVAFFCAGRRPEIDRHFAHGCLALVGTTVFGAFCNKIQRNSNQSFFRVLNIINDHMKPALQ